LQDNERRKEMEEERQRTIRSLAEQLIQLAPRKQAILDLDSTLRKALRDEMLAGGLVKYQTEEGSTVSIVERVTLNILKPAELLDALGPERTQQVMVVAESKVWEVLKADPRLLARLYTDGVVAPKTTFYVEVRLSPQESRSIAEKAEPTSQQQPLPLTLEPQG
jgi:hypothetical protein